MAYPPQTAKKIQQPREPKTISPKTTWRLVRPLEILATFGAFMAVLIAIEIFINITVYLRDDIIHVKIVMATALMAIARKVIILDFSVVTPDYILATAALVFAMGIGYWLVVKNADARSVLHSEAERCFENPDNCKMEGVDKKL